MQATLDDLERVQRTLATLLQIAQAEAGGGGVPPERVDLAQMATELGELYALEARERGLNLRVQAAGPANVRRPPAIARAAADQSAGKRDQVRARRAATSICRWPPSDSQITLSVTDDGPGNSGGMAHGAMLLPFRRLERDQGAPGSGLGLSLVAAVVRLHHGQLELLSAQPGLARVLQLCRGGLAAQTVRTMRLRVDAQ